jgi:Zn-dependent peptidase ImmA (M78 family)
MPEGEARKLLEEVGMSELPIMPMEICGKLGILYLEQPLRSIDGMLLVNPKTGMGLVSVNLWIREPTRKNFTCAHELGHYCLDLNDESSFVCSREDIESFKRGMRPIELRANQFAAALLMPRFLFKSLVDKRDPEWDSIKLLSDMSKTSLLSTAMRFMDMTEQSCVLIVSKNCAVSWFHPSGSFRAFIDMDSRVLSSATIAYQVFHGLEPPNNFEIVKADNWVSGRGVNAEKELLEWTLPMNSYGQVLTILLDEEGIEGWGKEEYTEDRENDECSTDWEPMIFRKSKRKK